jgi:hypothetical protein
MLMSATSKSNGAVAPPRGLPRDRTSELPVAISANTARLLGAVIVLAIGLIHILDAASTYSNTRWIFWAYMPLIAAAVPVALLLLHSGSPLAWVAAAAVAAGPLVGYLWSRAIGLPGDAPDIGNWLCTLGMAALFVETTLLGLSATRLVVERGRAPVPSAKFTHEARREATTGIEPV